MSQGEVYGSPRGCKTTTPIREEKEGMRLLNILGADCRVCRFLFYLTFCLRVFIIYRGNSSRHIHPSTPLCKRCCKNILRINERSLRNFSLDEKKDFFVFFSHSLRRYYDWKIIILLSMEFAIFLYILSRVKSCFLHFLDLSNVRFTHLRMVYIILRTNAVYKIKKI